MDNKNLTMLTDFYELTMANGYFKNGMKDTIVTFDMFFRKVPDGGGFAIMAGVAQLIDYLKDLHFNKDDISFLATKGFDDAFLNYLKAFQFTCDVWSVPEGTPIFPHEPIIIVKGPIIEAQLVETMILLTINHQSLIATKANRICRAAEGRAVMEFGSRRAQGIDGAVDGARAAYIGGCAGTACVMTDQQYGVPALGTMAHSWVQSFDTELDAFNAYAIEYPDSCTLLIDTYNVLKSGIVNAIECFNTQVVPRGFRPKGVRIDSGDITYLSKKLRRILDDAGYPDCGIVASNSLDENIIRDMLLQGAKIDSFGVGERMITSSSSPVFGGVYKLSSLIKDGVSIPKIKISENVAKITTPCEKRLYRFFEKESGKAIADVMTLADEVIDPTQEYDLFDPEYTWKRKLISDFSVKSLLVQIFDKGSCVYDSPAIADIKAYCKQQVESLWDEVLRFENPHNYYVDLSEALWKEKNRLISENSKKKVFH